MSNVVLNIRNILIRLDQEVIMKRYFPGHISFDQKYTNPFRIDSKRGCYFAFSNRGKLTFFDNAEPQYGGDCFRIAQLSLSKPNIKDTLIAINDDFNLGLKYSRRKSDTFTPYRTEYLKKIQDKNRREKEKALSPQEKESRQRIKDMMSTKYYFQVKARSFEQVDYDYWTGRYGIKLSLLRKYKVFPVSSYSKKKWDHKSFKQVYNYNENKNNPCYCYKFTCDGKTSLKIYKPFAPRTGLLKKWESNVSACNVQGYDQLVDKDDLLIVASSMKDLLVLVSQGYNAIAPQGETIGIPDDIWKDLRNRFKRIVFAYDRDNAGLKWSKHFAEKHNVEYVVLPKFNDDVEDKYKDFAEYYERLKQKKQQNLFPRLLKAMFDETNQS